MQKNILENYEEYKQRQLSRTKIKWGSKTFWDNLSEFLKLARDTQKIVGDVKEICCMGIRNGNEYFAFQGMDIKRVKRDDLKSFNEPIVYGIDLDGRVTGVGSNCYCKDFSKLPEEWKDKFDLVYSNSIDHCFNLEETLNEWHRITKPNGYILLALSGANCTACEFYQFEKGDEETMFDKNKFDIVKVWKDRNLDVLVKVKK